MSTATSDSAIQMMDRYNARCVSSGISMTQSFETDNGLAAATCLILSSKLHEIRPLSGNPYIHLIIIIVTNDNDKLLDFSYFVILLVVCFSF